MIWASHTPGPWECRRAVRPDNTGGYDWAIAADGKIIAEAFENVDFADGREGYEMRPVENNARLIAAAPELYQALVQTLPVIDDETRLGKQIRAALARARSEHPSAGGR